METGKKEKKQARKQKSSSKFNKKKEKKNQPRRQVPLNAFVFFDMAFINYLDGVFGNSMSLMKYNGDEKKNRLLEMYRLEKAQSNSIHVKFTRTMVKDVFGTWEPTLKLRSYKDSSTGMFPITATTGVLAGVVTINTTQIAKFSTLATVFDEYRAPGPFVFYYMPTYNFGGSGSPGGQAFAIGALDYSDNSLPNAIDSMLLYDTTRRFYLFAFNNPDFKEKWNGHIQEPPNTWQDTGVATNWAYFKYYNDTNLSGTITYGFCHYRIHIQFRQLAAL